VLFEWAHRDAAHVRPALETFECTHGLARYQAGGSRDWRQRHDKWWEYEVQSAIHKLKAPKPGSDRVLLLGWSGAHLGGVSLYQETDGSSQVELELMALSVYFRGARQGHAAEMVRETLEDIERRALAVDVPDTLVTGYIWHQNSASKRMVEASGFTCTGEGAQGVELWSQLLVHPLPL